MLLAKRENGEIDGGNNLDTKGVQRRKLKRCVGVLNLILSWKRNYGIRIKFNDKTIEEIYRSKRRIRKLWRVIMAPNVLNDFARNFD